jgi:hypothetical protein
MHEKKTTASVLYFNTIANAPAAVEMAKAVLSNARALHNTPHVVLMGVGLSQLGGHSQPAVDHVDGFLGGHGPLSELAAREHVHLVVSMADLALLRFLPNALVGELARVPDCIKGGVCATPPPAAGGPKQHSREVEAVLATLRRLPPIDFRDDPSSLPPPWEEHVVHTLAMNDRLAELWDSPPVTTSPFDALCLCMYAKMASMGSRTVEGDVLDVKRIVSRTPGAADAGLLNAFPEDGGRRSRSFLDFLDAYRVGEHDPWELTTRGRRAAAAARAVVATVFDRVASLASLLENAKLVLVLHDRQSARMSAADDQPTMVLHDGVRGRLAKVIAGRVPLKASATGRGLVVSFEPEESIYLDHWASRLNQRLCDLLEYSKNPNEACREYMTGILGAFASLSSSFLRVDGTIDNSMPHSSLSRLSGSIVTTHPALSTAHLQRELTIRHNTIKVRYLTASAAVQSGHSVACTHVTYCKKMAESLWSPQFDRRSLEGLDALTGHRELNAIADGMGNRSDPLGVFVGVVGGCVVYSDRSMRTIGWRRNGDEFDSYLSLVDADCLHLMFADYVTMDRMLRTDALEYEANTGPTIMPFIATETAILVPLTSAVHGCNELLFRLTPEHTGGWLGSDRDTIASLLTYTPRGHSQEAGGFRAFHTMESTNDRMCGLMVRWSTVRLQSATVRVLVSANSSNERVSF